MAIERAYGPLDGPRAPDAEEAGETAPDNEQGEGETLSMSLLGGNEVKPGDVVRIKVVSVDDQNGTWQGEYAEPAKPMGMKPQMAMEGAM